MRRACGRVGAALWLGLAASVVPQRAQAQSPDGRLARAIAALEATETERGVELLRQLVTTLPPTAPTALRRDAHLWLAVASASLGRFDSAAAHFQVAIGVDPFITLDPEQFNPDLLTIFRAAKRSTLAFGVRAPPDTALAPRTERWPISVAVPRSGTVRFRWAGPGPAGRDTLLASAEVDSTVTLPLMLPMGDSAALATGAYRLAVVYSEPGGDTVSTTLSLELTKHAVDTLPEEPPLADSLYRREVQRGAPSRAILVKGLAFGVAASVIPALLANSQLGGDEARGLVVGAMVSLTGLAGYFVSRPLQPLPENIAYNRALRSAWEARNRAIAAANERRRDMVLLRVRVVSQQ